MSLGFEEEYDLSGYTKEEFIEMWSESSAMGKELVDFLLESFDVKKILLPEESNELIRYVRGALFILGFSETDEGYSADLYDDNVSGAVIKAKTLMREIKMQIDERDAIDQKFIINLSQIFDIKDEIKIVGLWRALNSSTVLNAKTVTSQKTQVMPGPDSKGLAVVSAPPSSVNKGDGANIGVNFPTNKDWLESSIQYSLAKDGSKQLSTNFKVSDFRSKDGSDIVLINPNLIPILEKIREHFGKPVIVISGYRTPSHNRTLSGAAKNSQHMYGNAADIVIKGVQPREIFNWLKTWHKGGLGIYDTFVHVDVRNTIGQKFTTWDNTKKGKSIA